MPLCAAISYSEGMSGERALTSVGFAAASQPTEIEPGRWRLTVHPGWDQGRTLFGGLVAANMANAMASFAQPEQQLRVITTSFAAPISGDSADILVRQDRVGKSTTFTSAEIWQGDELKTRAHAIFAESRPTSITSPPVPGVMERTLDEAQQLPFAEGLVPNFIKHFDLRWGVGDFPYTGSKEGKIGGYCRHQEPAGGIAGILGLLDAWPPATLPMATGPASGSSMNWTAHFVGPVPEANTDWYEFRYDTVAAANGYATFAGTLSKDGQVIAWTEQLGAIFA